MVVKNEIQNIYTQTIFIFCDFQHLSMITASALPQLYTLAPRCSNQYGMTRAEGRTTALRSIIFRAVQK